MTLAELKNLVNSINPMGFKDEEVQVELKNTWTQSDMKITNTRTTVQAGEKVVPVVRIDLGC